MNQQHSPIEKHVEHCQPLCSIQNRNQRVVAVDNIFCYKTSEYFTVARMSYINHERV